jgi:hypothetical protein
LLTDTRVTVETTFALLSINSRLYLLYHMDRSRIMVVAIGHIELAEGYFADLRTLRTARLVSSESLLGSMEQ